jgi:hypothetical protein
MDLLDVRTDGVPAPIRGLDRWVPWRLAGRHKIPVSLDGDAIDAHDPQYWLPFEAACGPYVQRTHGVRGLGFALDGSGIATADFDRVVTKRGEIAPEARQWVDRLDSFAEYSPSGRGLHVLIAGALPEGNRSIPGLQVLTRGIVSVTGHVVHDAPIRQAGAAREQLLLRFPPRPATLRPGEVEPLRVPSQAELDVVLHRALRHPGFQRLWAGQADQYPSPSEADLAFCRYIHRAGGDLGVMAALLRTSDLSRPKALRDDFVRMTGQRILSTADVVGALWSGVSPDPVLVADNERRRQTVQRVERDTVLRADAPHLTRLAAEIASLIERGAPAHDGFREVSPAVVSGDYPAIDGLPAPNRLMSRQGCLKAWKRFQRRGLLDLRSGTAVRWWTDAQGRSQSQRVAVTLLRVDGHDFVSILEGFLHRAHAPPPCTCN